MATFSSLEIGLSFICGLVLLGCAIEVYYLLWWKKRKYEIDQENQKPSVPSFSSTYKPTHMSYISCWKNNSSTKPTKTQENNQNPDMGLVQDLVLDDSEEESLDLELMRLHNLQGPPRFLTTINEETKEDIESQRSRKCSRTKSLSDLLVHFETPQASSPIKSSSASQLLNLESFKFHQNNNGLNLNNPLFDIDTYKMRSSPPPTFKFLRDAEEKLLKKMMEFEAAEKEVNNNNQQILVASKVDENSGCFVKISASKGKNGMIQNNQQISSAASKVLPLASSPPNN
uniref:uncharacterized protein LOC122582624 n=1 Tax=Erigeron canadensis TaxID=72917 RepID=UPI001CB9D429|nr:uncharacterized protein LOC122582624 [Erigeron canadensis]